MRKIGFGLVVTGMVRVAAFVFTGCGFSVLFAQNTPALVSLDAALAGAAAADVGSRVTGKTDIVVAAIEAPLSAVSDFLSAELGKRLSASGKFSAICAYCGLAK
jgi:hypothetical protein